jgi:dTDP-4-dehydrorhamnose reductase
LLGASGFVGGVLFSHLSVSHDLVGTWSSRPMPGLRHLDLTDTAAVAALVDDNFDLVIHAAGVVDLMEAERNPVRAHAVNVHTLAPLLDVLDVTGTKLIYLSTDYVFEGENDSYAEQDQRSPVNVYGATKVAAEDIVLGASRHLVLRLPIMYGSSPWSDKFFARFTKPSITAQTDLVCTPLYLPSLPAAIETLSTETGVLHYAGREVLTRYDLMTRIRDALTLPNQILPVHNDETSTDYRRPRRLVLRSTRHTLSGPDLDTALHDMRHTVRG